MALRLQIVSRQRQGLGERGSMEFGRNGGTIGRSLESDWVLPDGQRYLSSRHASIDFRSGSYYVVDTSTNGVYVNEAEQPVGRGNPQRLFTGDRIRIGEYEISVEITDEDTRELLTDERHVDPVSKAQRVSVPDPTRADLVAPHEITGVGIEMLICDEAEVAPQAGTPPASATYRSEPASGSAVTKRAEPPPVSAAARIARPPPQPAPLAPQPAAGVPLGMPAPPAAAPAASARAAALDALLRGAGLPSRHLDDQQAEQALERVGQLLRELVVGVTDNLRLRGEQKNVLHVPATTVRSQADNPLKLAANVEQGLNDLLFRESADCLSGVDAVREAFGEIKQHQQHVLAAMRTAVVDYVGRLDPEDLENKIGSGRGGALIQAANKLKYWDLFKDLYQVVAYYEPGHFPQLFVEELARAYELEAARAVSPLASHHAKLG